MLRKGIVALMITVMSVGSVTAADGKRPTTLMDFIRGPGIGRPNHQQVRKPARSGGVQHAVVQDVARQVPEIRQTSSEPQKAQLQPAESTPQPLPVQYASKPDNVSSAPAPRKFSPQQVTAPQMAFQGNGWQSHQGPPAVVMAPAGPYNFVSSQAVAGGNVVMAGPAGGTINGGNGPGALYPAPKPGVPQNIGGTAIVHEALHPHEMLYPHRYKAMYGPYYHKVHGGWVVTPFGVWSKENWKLKGTTVDVKYKSHISPFAMFHPPVIR